MCDSDDYDSDSSFSDSHTEWIRRAEMLCTMNHEYIPIPSIRVVYILPSGEYKINVINRSDTLNSWSEFHLSPEPGTIIRDISLFAFDIPKQKLSVGVACSYVSIDSMDKLRERLVELHAFPCFFDLFEILVILNTKPETPRPPSLHVSALKTGGNKSKTRKSVRFHHSCTRRN